MRKKIFCSFVLLVAICLIGCTGGNFSTTEAPANGVVVYTKANFRARPNGTPIHAVLTEGTNVTVLEKIKHEGLYWYSVYYNGENGFLYEESVQLYGDYVKQEYPRGKNENGKIVYSYVNLREYPNGPILDVVYRNEWVEIIQEEGRWTKVKHDNIEGYLISESISIQQPNQNGIVLLESVSTEKRSYVDKADPIIIIDLSHNEWNNTFPSEKEFKEFVLMAKENLNLGGFYIQVLQNIYLNTKWTRMVSVLEELEIPYGLYVWTNKTSEWGAKEVYNKFLQETNSVDMKWNVFPFMIDLEPAVGGSPKDQTAIINFFNKKLGDDYIVYACASAMRDYKYYETAPQLWVAHYKICKDIPTKEYAEYKGAYSFSKTKEIAMWQFTSTGNQKLLGTSKMDLNLVNQEWYNRYVK